MTTLLSEKNKKDNQTFLSKKRKKTAKTISTSNIINKIKERRLNRSPRNKSKRLKILHRDPCRNLYAIAAKSLPERTDYSTRIQCFIDNILIERIRDMKRNKKKRNNNIFILSIYIKKTMQALFEKFTNQEKFTKCFPLIRGPPQ